MKIYGKSFGGVACSTLAKYASAPKRHMINGSGQVALHQQVFTTSLFSSFYPCVTFLEYRKRLVNLNLQNLRRAYRNNLIDALHHQSIHDTSNRHRLPINKHTRTHILLTPSSCLQGHVKLDLTHFRCLMSFSRVSPRNEGARPEHHVFVLLSHHKHKLTTITRHTK